MAVVYRLSIGHVSDERNRSVRITAQDLRREMEVIEPKDKDLFEKKGVRLVLFVAIPAVLFALVSAGIRVSQYGIDHTIVVLGQRKLVAGQPGAIRVTLLSDEGGFFLPETLVGYLVRPGEKHKLFEGNILPEGFSLGRDFHLPKVSPGPATLELDIGFDNRRRIVRADVEITNMFGKEQLTVPDDAALGRSLSEVEKDGITLTAFPEDRGLVTGLGSVIFVRSTDPSGKPVPIDFSMEVTLELEKTPGREKCRTDKVGLYGRLVTPRELALPMKIFGARDPEREEQDGGPSVQKDYAYLFPKIVYGDVAVSIHNPIAMQGSPVRISASQISAGGPAYGDVFYGGQWVAALSTWFRGKKAEFEYWPKLTGLHRIQVSTSTLIPGNKQAVRHFYVLRKDQDAMDGLREILRELRSSEVDGDWARHVIAQPLERGVGYDRGVLGAFALARLYRGHHALTRLVSSRREDDAELAAFKRQFQRGVMIAIMLLGLGVALMISMIAFQARRRQQRITMMILSESDQDGLGETWQTDMGERSARRRVVFQGIVLFLIILGAFASIALLINTLTWRA